MGDNILTGVGRARFWMSQAVSDLTATDAPSFVVASGFVTVYKIFNCLCCALLCILIKNENKKSLRLGVYLFSIMNFLFLAD